MKKILGLWSGHDASFCVLNDGKIELHTEAERHLRVKEPPYDSIKLFFDHHGDVSDIIGLSTCHLDNGIKEYKQSWDKISGIAPLVVGLPALTLISYYTLPYAMTILDRLTKGGIPSIAEAIVMIGSLWAIIAVSASIFPSPEDMHGVWPVIITLLLFCIPLFFSNLLPQVPASISAVITLIVGRLIEGVRISLFSHLVLIVLFWRFR
jgi:hypothetical protein